MSEEKKRFDEWEVDCNTCERYWLNQCDGAKCGSKAKKQPCNSYLASRKVVIPQQIKSLERAVFKLKIAIAALFGAVGGIIIAHWFG